MNAFKDKLVDAMPGAMRDLGLVPEHAGFEDARFVALTRDTGAATVVGVVAKWLISVRKSPPWSRLRAALGPSPRPIYEALFGLGVRGSHVPRAALRILVRAGADSRRERLRALYSLGLRAIEDNRETLANVPAVPDIQPSVRRKVRRERRRFRTPAPASRRAVHTCSRR